MIYQKAGIIKCVSLDNNYIPSIKQQIQILVPFFTSLTTSAEGFQKFKMSPPHFEIQEQVFGLLILAMLMTKPSYMGTVLQLIMK